MVKNLKIESRSTIVKNICTFVVLTPLFIHISKSIAIGESAFTLTGFMGFIKDYSSLHVFCLFLLYSIWQIRSWSKILFLVFLLSNIVLEIYLFTLTYEKLIIVLSFMHLIIGYNYFLLLDREFSDVVYVPGYNEKYLDIVHLDPISIVLTKGKSVHRGVLTNWSKKGFFIYLLNKEMGQIKGDLQFEIYFESKMFCGTGRVITRTPTGLGIKIITKEKQNFNWSSLYSILNDRGLKPLITT